MWKSADHASFSSGDILFMLSTMSGCVSITCFHPMSLISFSEAAVILTFNLRHFRPEHLAMWRVRAVHPQSFLIEIFRLEQAVVMTKLEQLAADRGRTLRQLLDILSGTVPDFVALVAAGISR